MDNIVDASVGRLEATEHLGVCCVGNGSGTRRKGSYIAFPEPDLDG